MNSSSRDNRTKCVLLAVVIAVANGCIADANGDDDEAVVEQDSITNPLVNGGFEQGLTGWDLADGRWPAITAAAAHSGSKGARFTSTATADSCLMQRIAAKPGWRYTFSGYYRWHSGASTHDIFMLYSDSAGGFIGGTEFRYSKATAWTKAVVMTDSPAAAAILEVDFGRCNVAGAAVWDWDGLAVTSCAKPDVACSSNADCCSGSCYNHEGGYSCR